MKFQFFVTLTDNDYLDYNMFCSKNSEHVKKLIRIYRILIGTTGFLIIFNITLSNNFSPESTRESLIILANVVVLIIALSKINRALTLLRAKRLLRDNNHKLYDPKAVLDFYDDKFTETTPSERCERRYSTIESVAVLSGKAVYLRTDKLRAFIIPMNLFTSYDHYNDFINFLRSKSLPVEIFN